MNARHALALACAITLSATPADSVPLTLPEVVKLVFTGNPTIGKERARLAAARSTVSKAVSGAEPTLEVDGVVSAGKDVVTGGTPLEDELLRTSVPKHSYDVVLDQPVFDGGKTIASLSSAIASVRSEAFKLDSVEQDTLLQVAQDYLDVLRDQIDIPNTERSAKLAADLLHGVEERARHQDASRVDILTAQSTMDEAMADEATARAKLADDQGAFLRDTGVDAQELQLPTLSLVLPHDEDEAIERVADNPDILSAQYAARSSKADVDVARSAGRPSAEIEGDIHRRDDAVFKGERESVRSISLKVRVPIFSGGAVRADVEAKQALAKSDDYALIDARQQAEAKARSAFRQLAPLAAALEHYRASASSKDLLVKGQTRLQSLSEAADTDILTAQRTLLDTERDENHAVHDQLVAELNLYRAMGKMTPKIFDVDVNDPDLIVSVHRLIMDGISVPFIR